MRLPFIIFGVQILFGIAVVALLIYFIVKRIKDKEKENFEKRDS